MHRFYCVHSFKSFHRHLLATAALFLAAKSEEQPRKLQYVAQASYACVYKDQPMLDIQSQTYTKLVEDITYYELLLLETLGFEVQVDHPHPHVVKCMQFLKASKDLAQMAYFMAHNSLLLTTFCLEHSPSTVACVCIHLSCRWKGLDIPRSSDGKSWWEYIDHSINRTKLDDLTKEFLMIYDKSPSRLQKKITEPIKLQGSSAGLGASSSVGGVGSGARGQSSSHSSSEKGKRPVGPQGHPVKHQKSYSQSSSHSNKPHPSAGDQKNHVRSGSHSHPLVMRGVKRHSSPADRETHKKRIKTETNSQQPPLPPVATNPSRPPLPSGPPPSNSTPFLSHHHHHPHHHHHHHHHKPHPKHGTNSLAPPLPPPLPLSPSPPPPPPPPR